MMTTNVLTVKHVGQAVVTSAMLVLAERLLLSVDVVQGARFWSVGLPSLLRLAAFTCCSSVFVLAAVRLVGPARSTWSDLISRILADGMFAIAVVFEAKAVQTVLYMPWRQWADLAEALLLVVLAAHAIWLAYANFDLLATLVRRTAVMPASDDVAANARRASSTQTPRYAPPLAPATRYCGHCGSETTAGYRFCPTCGGRADGRVATLTDAGGAA